MVTLTEPWYWECGESVVFAVRDWVLASPVSFAIGVVLGLWIGARFDIRKKRDV